jgi:hypothetical protein
MKWIIAHKWLAGILAAVIVGGGITAAVLASRAQANEPDPVPAIVADVPEKTTEPESEAVTTEPETESATETATASPIAAPTTTTRPTTTAAPTTTTKASTTIAPAARPDIVLHYHNGGPSPHKLVWNSTHWGGDPNNGPGNIARGYYEYKGAAVPDTVFAWPDGFMDQWMFASIMGGPKVWTVTRAWPGEPMHLYGNDRFIPDGGYSIP